MKHTSVKKMTISALLIAIGIIIPLFSPIRFVWEPASFTLASHVPIFIAMFISPLTAIVVCIGTAIGFLFNGSIIITLRATSHIIFATIGAIIIQKRPEIVNSPVKLRVFSLCIGVIHSLCELIVVSFFYFGGGVSEAFYNGGFLYSVVFVLGIGGLIHSMVDFEIALLVVKALKKNKAFSEIWSFTKKVKV